MKNAYVTALIQLLNSGSEPELLFKNLTTVLKQRGHIKLLPAILTELTVQMESESHKDSVRVVVAKELQADDVMLTKVLAALSAEGKSVNIVVDDKIIGGMVATYKNRQIDQSYRTKLQDLYKSIISTNTITKN